MAAAAARATSSSRGRHPAVGRGDRCAGADQQHRADAEQDLRRPGAVGQGSSGAVPTGALMTASLPIAEAFPTVGRDRCRGAGRADGGRTLRSPGVLDGRGRRREAPRPDPPSATRLGRAGAHQLVLVGEDHQLDAVGQPELGEQMAHVRLHAAGRHVHLERDVGVGQAAGDQLQHRPARVR